MSKTGLLNGTKASKVQDDANMKALRELSQVPCNRHCFDCAQRGPTYVNTTIGSFVCMTCSGLLRGLTPPHRVKSISMASFSADEIEVLKSRGNEYCRKVWLATHTPRDSHLGSEQDPDRRNALKSHMSTKYEQKRYYVDPAKLPKSELTEIQAATAKALSSSSGSSLLSNSSGGSGSGGSTTMQKSPSLSSASSGSSLSLHHQQQQNNPSPVMNNLRNNTQSQQPHRLVNSVTLPDIKPLSTLIGSVNLSNGNHHQSALINSPAPINFINNLSSTDEKIINTNQSQAKDPWGGSGGMSNGFNANFANFDEAFCGGSHQSNGNPNNFDSTDLFNSPQLKSSVQNGGGLSNGFGVSANNFANFDSVQIKPLVPFQNGTNGHTTTNTNSSHNDANSVNSSNGTSAQDRYAALKDLDDMFKHVDPPAGTGVSSNGMPNSASVPANLSSSSGGGSAGWYSTSPNQPNPFSQVAASPPQGTTNGWGLSNGTSTTGTNPHNPFFSSPSWQTSNNNGTNGNHHPNSSSSMFPPSQSMNFHQLSSSSVINNSGGFPPMGSSPGGLFSQQNSSNFINSPPATKPIFNPFNFSNNPATVNNPNNPFL